MCESLVMDDEFSSKKEAHWNQYKIMITKNYLYIW